MELSFSLRIAVFQQLNERFHNRIDVT